MKKYVVEIEEKITYKVEFSADSQEYAERRVREIYDSGALKSTGELESVIFDVIDDLYVYEKVNRKIIHLQGG